MGPLEGTVQVRSGLLFVFELTLGSPDSGNQSHVAHVQWQAWLPEPCTLVSAARSDTSTTTTEVTTWSPTSVAPTTTQETIGGDPTETTGAQGSSSSSSSFSPAIVIVIVAAALLLVVLLLLVVRHVRQGQAARHGVLIVNNPGATALKYALSFFFFLKEE